MILQVSQIPFDISSDVAKYLIKYNMLKMDDKMPRNSSIQTKPMCLTIKRYGRTIFSLPFHI